MPGVYQVRLHRNWARGCYVVSDVINGQLFTKMYYGYTKDEAVSGFRDYVRYLYDPNYEPGEIADETFAR